jgi:hypothetical protein
LIGAAASYLPTRNQDIKRSRIDRTLRLMEQYNSAEFLKMRGEADRILDAYFETHERCSWNELYHSLKENYTPVSAVEHFFRMVLYFHESGEIDDALAKKFWAQHYNHWYSKYFGSLSDASIRNGDETENSTMRRLLHWLSSK